MQGPHNERALAERTGIEDEPVGRADGDKEGTMIGNLEAVNY